MRLADGYVAAAPALKEALHRYRAEPLELDWLSFSYDIVAMDLWDDEAWFELAAGQLRLARANGTLSWLPFALDYLAEIHVQAGELSTAAALLMERERVDPGTREATLPYVPLLLAAWRGDATEAADLAGEMARGASDRGEGAALTYTDYAQAVLYNGQGNYRAAAEAAGGASGVDEIVISPWALYELVEAAVRSDQRERARAAADQLSQLAAASASNWALGAAARSRALVSGGRAAEEEYREAIDLLGKTRMATHLARARLVYGEWLRREKRRIDARDQLRSAFDALASMGAEAFAERARRELQATGETVRKRSDDTRVDLTPQEEEIAQLACEGRTSSEIGAQLFIGRRTVEWHLGNVFAKLDIGSRLELDQALRKRSIRSSTRNSGSATRSGIRGYSQRKVRRWVDYWDGHHSASRQPEPAHPASTIPGRLRRVASRRERRAGDDPNRRRAVHRLRAGQQRAGGAALRPGRSARGSDAAHGHRGPPADRGLPRASLALTPYGQDAQVRHVVPGQIVQLTSIWDGSMVTPAWITQHMSSRSRARTPARARGYRADRLRTPVMLRRPQQSQAFPLDRQQAERVAHRGATGESPGIIS